MTSESDSWARMDDSSSFQSQPMISPLTRTTSKATAWTVDLAPSAGTLPRYPQASISSVRLAARLKRKHLSSDIRKNNYPAEQYTPPKTTAHYTISQDCTAGFEVRKRELLADFGKKSQKGKNCFRHLGNIRLEPDITHRHAHTSSGQQIPPSLDMARLSSEDKAKVTELATKMYSTASEQQKQTTYMQLTQRVPPAQIAELQAQGKDLLMWFYQHQAFGVLRANMIKIQKQQQQQGGIPQAANNNQA
ncbi:hypothetical protein HG530_014700 [Fusarium avenaceum]|nr:hypothetical protein HG530_014700 [Fusarium avenaceum]